MSLSIGISTFVKRFDMLKELVTSIRSMDQQVNILIAVNGENGAPFHEDYRRDLLLFLSEHPRVFPIFFPEFRSLSKLWNTLVIHSPDEHVLILNDDVEFKSKAILPTLRNYIDATQEGLFYAGWGWSHFVVSKSCLNELGWFDERLLGVGEEDGDMLWRYEQKYGKSVRGCPVNGIGNKYDHQRGSDNVEKAYGNKTKFNTLFLYGCKYQRSEHGARGMFSFPVEQRLPNEGQYPYEKFYWDRRHLLNDTAQLKLDHEFHTEWIGEMKPWTS